MAGTVRDMFLAVRVVDRATGPLRRIAGDVRRMEGSSAGAAAREAAALQRVERHTARIDAMRAKMRDLSDPGGTVMTRNAARRAEIMRETTRLQNNLADKEAAITRNVRAQNALRENVDETINKASARQAQFYRRTANQLRTLREQQAAAVQRVRDLPEQQGLDIARKRIALDRATMNLNNNLRAQQNMINAAQEEGVELDQAHLQRLREQEQVLRQQQILQDRMLQRAYFGAGVARGQTPESIARRIQEVTQKRALGPPGFTPEDTARRVQTLRRQEQGLIDTGRRLQRQREELVASLRRQQFATAQLTADEQKEMIQREQLRARILAEAEARNVDALAANREAQAIERYAARERLIASQVTAQRVEHLGHTMSVFGLVTTAALGIAAKQAADFTTQVTLAATQARKTSTQVPVGMPEQSARDVQRISSRIQKTLLTDALRGDTFVAPLEEQTSSLYRILSGTDLQLGQAINSLRLFNKVAAANYGVVSLEEVTKAGVVIMNQFDVSVKKLPQTLNFMQAAVRFGNMNLSEFIQSLNQAAPAARAAGFNFTEMSGTVAALSRDFPSLRMGTTGYARLVETLGRPDIVQGLRSHGVEITRNVNGVRKLVPLQEIARRIFVRYGKSVKDGSLFVQNFFKEQGNTASTIQARRVLVSLVGDYANYQKVLGNVTADQKELNIAVNAMKDQPSVRLARLKVQLQAVAIVIGNEVLPVFLDLANHLVRAITWFKNLDEETRNNVIRWIAWIGIATLVGGAILTVVGGIASLIFTLRLMGGSAIVGSAAIMIIVFAMIRWHGWIMRVVDELGGLQGVLKFAGFSILASTLLRSAAGMTALGAAAGGSRALLTGLLITLTRLARVWTVTLVLMFVLDKDFRSWYGDLANGRLDWQKRFDKWLQQKRHDIIQPFTKIPVVGGLFKIGTEAPNELDYLTKAQDQAFQKRTVKQQRQLDNLFNPAGQMERQKKTVRQTSTIWEQMWKERQRQRTEAQAKALASSYGIIATPTFKQLYRRLLAAKRQMDDALAKLQKNANDKNQAAYLKSIENFENARMNLQNFTDAERYKAALKTINETTKKNKDSLNQQKQDFRNMMDTIMGMYDQLKQKNEQIMGDLFQGPMSGINEFRKQWGAAPTGGLLLKDIQGRNRQFSRFFNILDTLRRRGAPRELIQQIQAQGLEALPEAIALLRMPRSMWNRYLAAFAERDRLIKQQTQKDLNDQLSMYREFGRNLSQAIKEGIQDERPGLRAEIRNLVLKMFPELRPGGAAVRKNTTAAGSNNTTNSHNTTNYHLPINGTGKEDTATLQARQRAKIRNRPHFGGRYGPGAST